MAQYRRPNNNRLPPRGPSDTRTLRRLPDPSERRAPVVYGKPFMLMEDAEKNTYIFEGGSWVLHSASIAECRQTCLVKELPQRVNGRIRYEIRKPVGA